MIEYIKKFLALFVLMTLLLYLVPGERFKNYIRFFSEIVLTVGILSPLLSFVFDNEKFLAMIEYETFTEALSEIARDMERMEFIQNDYYQEEYEKAIEEDAGQVVRMIAETYSYEVANVEVELTEDYRLKSIEITVLRQGQESIVVEEITWAEHSTKDDAMNGENGMTAEMKRKLADYYQLDEKFIVVQCAASG